MEEKQIKVELLVNFLYPNIILKGDSYTLDGEKVWDGNKPMPLEVIDKLKARKVQKIYYTRSSKLNKPIASKPMIGEEQIQNAIDISKELEGAVTNKAILPQAGVDEVVDGFMESLSNSDGTVLNLVELKDFDDYTYTHSINVCLVAMLFAKRLSYNPKGIKIIGISALLHDLGKIIVPKEILNKPFKLTADEFDIIKKHPVYSYEYIKSQSSYGPLIQKAVLLHHEKYTGKGYPFGFRGEQIGEIAQIISLADVFDAITSERSYKPARPFWYALSMIKKMSGVDFAPRLAMTFVQDMPRFLTEGEIFSKGSFVLLNTGEVGEVVDYKYPQTLKPVVEIYINAKKTVVRYPIPVNLEFDDSRQIENVFEDETMIERIKVIKERFEKKDAKPVETVVEAPPIPVPETIMTEAAHSEPEPAPEEIADDDSFADIVNRDKDLFIADENDLK